MNRAYQLIMEKKLLYPKLPRVLVESYYALTDYLDLSTYGTCYCPFHEDRNKPSAKFFKDDDGVERIYCFAERKQFSSYEYVKLILNEDPILKLTKEIPERELEIAIQDYIANAGKLDMRKSKIDDDLIKGMNEKEFIKYILTGEVE